MRFRILKHSLIVVLLFWLLNFTALATHPTCAQTDTISRIAFGSCASQQKPCPIWGAMADYQPELLLLLGDNIYADVVEGKLVPSTPGRIAEAYAELAALPDFVRLRNSAKLMATWDDHDYGNNDAGIEWEHKDVAAKLFHDFLGTPFDSAARQQQGIYNAQTFGESGKRIQIIMLDTRYFRSQLEQSDERMPGWRSKPYKPATGPDASMLGDAQWTWLEEQLRQPAELRIIASSIQVISDEHPFEKWSNFPHERQRLYDTIRKTSANGVVIISGDRHLGDISVDDKAVGYPLYDVTASGLNQATLGWRMMEPNSHRVAGLPYGNHFGVIEVDWQKREPIVSLQLRHEDGQLAVQSRFPLSVLKFRNAAPEVQVAGMSTVKQALDSAEGTQLTVQMLVSGGRAIEQGKKLLLNSEADFRNDGNLTVVVNDSQSQATVNSYLNKQIRATGRVTLYNGRKQLEVEFPSQIVLVEE